MPDYTRGETRDILTAVKVISPESNLYYAWKAKEITKAVGVSTDDLAALGHLLVSALPDQALYVLRAQSPKPGRVTKVINKNPGVSQKGSVSTFVAADSLKTAIAKGWNSVKRPRTVGLKTKTRYTTAIAELSNGILYAFPLNTKDFTENKAALGLKAPSDIRSAADRRRLVQGASVPRPAEVAKDLGDGKIFSTFCSTDGIESAIAAGFDVLREEYILT